MTDSVEPADFCVGAEAPVLVHELVSADFIHYAGASGDFFPLHTDDSYARAAGFDTAFAHGMYSAGLLATAVTNYFGIGTLQRYKVRFAAKAWPGETLRTRITVIAVRFDGTTPLVDFECSLGNADGEFKIKGSGTAAVMPGPSPSTPSEEVSV